jgi:hypothetical protein
VSCSCSTDRLRFTVPDAYRDLLPEHPATVAVCPTCLTIEPADRHAEEGTVTPADLADVSPAFPPDEDAAVPMVLAIGLLTSMALHRDAIDELLTAVEAAGVDPMLVLDRLQTDPNLDPAIDVSRRHRQLEQLRD